jgi:hypothetical protein
MSHTYWLTHNVNNGDPSDPLSVNTAYRHWNAPHKGKAEWMHETGGTYAPPETACLWGDGCVWMPVWSQELTGSGRVVLSPTEVAPTTLPITARVPIQWDAAARPIEYLYVEYRTRTGFDDILTWAPAIVVTTGPAYNGFQNLYGQENGATYHRAYLIAGQAWTDCARGLHVAAVTLGTTATVDMQTGYVCPPPPPPPPPCVPPSPKSKKCK